MHGHDLRHAVKNLKRKVARLECKEAKQAADLANLKAQMRKAGLVARVEAIEALLGL